MKAVGVPQISLNRLERQKYHTPTSMKSLLILLTTFFLMDDAFIPDINLIKIQGLNVEYWNVCPWSQIPQNNQFPLLILSSLFVLKRYGIDLKLDGGR